MKHLRTFSMLIILVATILISKADSYKVIATNNNLITCNGVACTKGTVLDDPSKIEWNKSTDAIKLMNTVNHHNIVLSADKHKTGRAIKLALISFNDLSGRGKLTLDELIAEMRQVHLFDEWDIYTDYETDDTKCFVLKYLYEGQEYETELAGDADGHVVISREQLTDMAEDRINASLYYRIGDEPIHITDTVTIYLDLPAVD